MNVLELVEPQPNFPYEDLSDNNYFYLGLILSAKGAFRRWHALAEKEYPIFTGTHKPLNIASENIFQDPEKVDRLDFGIVTFEALTALVDASRPTPALKHLEVNINNIVKPANVDGVVDYFEQSQCKFLQQTPRTAEVIAESATSYRLNPGLAILGGAVARAFMLDNTD